MKIIVKYFILFILAVFLVLGFTACDENNGKGEEEYLDDLNFERIASAKIYTINRPVAGNYPQGLFRYPYAEMSTATGQLFLQTLDWLPDIPKTFATNTQYTAVLTLTPVSDVRTFRDIEIDNLTNLPIDGVENISISVNKRVLEIRIKFEKTANIKADAQIIFEDNFTETSLDGTKWQKVPQYDDRQEGSSWRDDMVEVSGGYLRLKFKRDPDIAPAKYTGSVKANWIRGGGIRTRSQNHQTMLFENSFGYYEARVKFPQVHGTWGAFWLMSRTQQPTDYRGVDGAEIDIVESITYGSNRYNAAVHWNGYNAPHHTYISSSNRPVNIYDGEFHIFAVDWSPSGYTFYVDNQVFWTVDGGGNFKNCGINRNPNYIKLTTEAASLAGNLPASFDEDEVLVDYVKVYNQPKN